MTFLKVPTLVPDRCRIFTQSRKILRKPEVFSLLSAFLPELLFSVYRVEQKLLSLFPSDCVNDDVNLLAKILRKETTVEYTKYSEVMKKKEFSVW